MIKSEKNPRLRELWNCKEDDLSKKKVRLINSLWRVASANNKNDMASSPAPVTFGSEVAKWEIKKDFNPVKVLRGRQDGAFGLGIRKMVLESSPYIVGDYLYKEVFRDGTIILQPHHRCPHCSGWQVLTDKQIKMRDKSAQHSAAYLRYKKQNAAYYECEFCGHEITEGERTEISEYVVWAAPKIETDDFQQAAEIIYPDGSIDGRLEHGVRDGYDCVCYNWSRLVDVAFPFWECLARWFESCNDPVEKQSYLCETMARWYKPKTGQLQISGLTQKQLAYNQRGSAVIPDPVIIITLGVDTHDDRFDYSWVGWGYGLEWFVLRHGSIPIKYLKDGDKIQTYKNFKEALETDPLLWPDGTPATYRFGLIDRGGHRADEVDYICQQMPLLNAYIGANTYNSERPVIYKSDRGSWYMGHTESLSDMVGEKLESDAFWLPNDTSFDFKNQILKQYRVKKVSPDGIISTKWIHGGDDHYRDTLNYNMGAGIILNLQKILFDKDACETLKKNRLKLQQQNIRQQGTEIINRHQPRATQTCSTGGYFGRALAGRR
jgi:hypothetical protein